MSKKNLGNMNLNFEKKSVSALKEDDVCNLFKCFECGFHPDVIISICIKGYEDEVIHFTQKIKPGILEKPEALTKNKLTREGEYLEEYTCGKCGRPGIIMSVPKNVLESMGFHINKNVDSSQKTERSFLNKMMDVIKGGNSND